MKKPLDHDPLDTLGEAYEKMFERAAAAFHSAEEKSGTLFHKLIDEAKEKAVELEEVTREDAEKLSAYLKRDLAEAGDYLSETGRELKDWLGFETTLLESSFFDLLLKAADKTTLKLLRFREDAQWASIYRTGEITSAGTLVCDQCGEKLHFRRAGKIPPCPKCHATMFHR
ncbi:MAG: zinc ribbon-containing protein [Thiogranum sp.]